MGNSGEVDAEDLGINKRNILHWYYSHRDKIANLYRGVFYLMVSYFPQSMGLR